MNIRSLSKINLALEIISKRRDGFHDINSIFTTVDICDKIEIESGVLAGDKDICVVQGNENLAMEPDNICVKAAEEFRKYVIDKLGREQKIEIHKGSSETITGVRDDKSQLDIVLENRRIILQKNIPVGAGLGGGSGNAAAVIFALNKICGTKLTNAELFLIAQKLGSDVPFFLQGKTAIATSRGEELNQLELKLPYTALVINVGIHISTPWAYKALNRTDKLQATNLQAALDKALRNIALFKELFRNDFEEPVFKEYQVLATIKSELYNQGAFFALMSGSGSSMFGLFENKEDSQKAENFFIEKYAGCFSKVAKIGV